MKCRGCQEQVQLVISCRAVTLRCTACGGSFRLSEYIDEIDEDAWERISQRPANRA